MKYTLELVFVKKIKGSLRLENTFPMQLYVSKRSYIIFLQGSIDIMERKTFFSWNI